MVSGFGRGSKLLGCPTANLDPTAFQHTLVGVPRGVYMGWVQVGPPSASTPVYKTVLSLGTNTTFADVHNETVESYVLHDFPSDFYGQTISIVILAFLRPMHKYDGLAALIKDIERDVRVGDVALDRPEFAHFKNDHFFKQ